MISKRQEPPVESFTLDDWRTARTDAFTVHTNASEAKAQRVLRRIDRFVATVSLLLDGRPFSPQPPWDLFLFRDLEQFRAFGGDWAVGHAGHLDESLFLSLSLDRGGYGGVLHHEIVHLLLFEGTHGDVPSWLHEGLAGFFGTATVRRDVLTIGGLSLERRDALGRRGLPLDRIVSLRQLTSERTVGEVGLRYAESWAFVHFALLGDRGEQRGPGSLEGLEQRLRTLFELAGRLQGGEAPGPAIEAAFGEDFDRVARSYEAHRRSLVEGRVQQVWHFVVPERELSLAWAPVPENEAAMLLAGYAEMLFPDRPLTASLWDHALRSDPDEPLALEGRTRAAAAAGDLALARELWVRLPEEERRSPGAAWTAGVLAHAEYEALPPEDRTADRAHLEEAREHYRRVLEASPDRARALASLGRTHVLEEDGDPAAGIGVLERALALQPGNPEVRLDLATLLLRDERFPEARDQLRYVIETHPSDALVDRAQDLLDQVDAEE